MENSRKNLNISLYKKLYLIRRVEEAIIKYYPEDEMKTPMHMSMGEEAIISGVCQALGEKNQALGYYRSHALYLAKTEETDAFFSEMYGKMTGTAKSKVGSMHLSSPEKGLLGVSAIVASTIPVAVGAAFANKVKNNGKIVAVFFGDGAIEEGVFWESLNVACLMKLPVLFVCEDNDFAVHTRHSQRQGFGSISHIVDKFKCNVLDEKTTDVEAIYELSCKAMKLIETTHMPSFLYLKYHRYLEHVGVNEDFNMGYRSREEFEKYYQLDGLMLQRKKLLNLGYGKLDLEKIENEIDVRIEKSISKAKSDPFPRPQELYTDVY